MNLTDAKQGQWVRVIGGAFPEFPWGTEILLTNRQVVEGSTLIGVTSKGELVYLVNPLGVSLPVELVNPKLTFGDLEPGDDFREDGDDETVYRKLATDTYLYNYADTEWDGIAVDVDTHEPFNFSNSDEVTRE